MRTSLFEIFKVGIGPSSSHTTGPMRAAHHFVEMLADQGLLHRVARLETHLYGSLGLTGVGHGTGRAVVLGLSGHAPEKVDPDAVEPLMAEIAAQKTLSLRGSHPVPFEHDRHIHYHKRERMPLHPNGMRLDALDATGAPILSQGYYSVGGGAIVREGEDRSASSFPSVPYPFQNAAALVEIANRNQLQIWEVGLENEKALHSLDEIHAWLRRIWQVMQDCVRRGLRTEGELPGGLHVMRRAPNMERHVERGPYLDTLEALDWVNACALAVSEQNAAGAQVVTAPTNGAAGVIPAVAHYYMRYVPGADEAGLFRFFLTAAVIGTIYKENASISGAEVGCQGEVGVACSMAAAGLTAAQGGDNHHVEKAAEIGMEHNLGLTCDPVGGLVQIPCIERNAMGAVKALNACRIALQESGKHRVSLDQVIETMLETGRDMQRRYKETSLGGLAVHVKQC